MMSGRHRVFEFCTPPSGTKADHGAISFTFPAWPGSLCPVKSLALALLICSACALAAQEQGGKLMGRLLRPNMAQGNSSQNHKFIADKASVDRHARVSTFYLQKHHEAQAYSNTRAFGTTQFYGKQSADLPKNSSLLAARSTSQLRSYDTPTARTSVELRDAHSTVTSSNFAGNRPFLEKGKSQKSLDRKNKPMTIDDIRELLNKNK